MAMGPPKSTLVLDSELREQLEGLANSRSLAAGLVRRAKIILLSASGKNDREIAPQLETSRNTVGLWRRRFLAQGVSGLYDELRPGRPRPISDERVAQLVRKTLKSKPKAATHWSIRQIADETGGIEIDGTSHLASVWLAATSTKIFQAFERSIFCRKSTRYSRAVSKSPGKCSGFVCG
jgi:transposase